jgi:undecaprenyl diphosphate synthase
VPTHIAIIMDGNGRWAISRGLPRLAGHRAGTENLRRIIEACIEFGELQELHDQGVQLHHFGRLDRLSPSLQEKVMHAVEFTRLNTRLVLNVAFNYGGRDEIVCAIQKIIEDGVRPEDVDDEVVSRYLFTAGVPDPDLIIRTSGELRGSNFLIWQGAYSEWYFTPTYWPDFNREELLKALHEYAHRERRYGGANSIGEDAAAHAR